MLLFAAGASSSTAFAAEPAPVAPALPPERNFAPIPGCRGARRGAMERLGPRPREHALPARTRAARHRRAEARDQMGLRLSRQRRSRASRPWSTAALFVASRSRAASTRSTPRPAAPTGPSMPAGVRTRPRGRRAARRTRLVRAPKASQEAKRTAGAHRHLEGAERRVLRRRQRRGLRARRQKGTLLWKTQVDAHPHGAHRRRRPTLYQDRLYVAVASSEQRCSGRGRPVCLLHVPRQRRGARHGRPAASLWKTYIIGEEPRPLARARARRQFGPAGVPVSAAPTIDAEP